MDIVSLLNRKEELSGRPLVKRLLAEPRATSTPTPKRPKSALAGKQGRDICFLSSYSKSTNLDAGKKN